MMIAQAKSGDSAAKSNTCIVPGCGRVMGLSRGLCTGCYATAKRMVDMQKTTWEELERLGLSRQPQRYAGGAPIKQALEAARAKAGKHTTKKRSTSDV